MPEQVIVERHVEAPPEVAFRFLTDSERWTQWQGQRPKSMHVRAVPTRLRLIHEELPEGFDVDVVKGWEHYLDRFVMVAEGRDPGPDSSLRI